MERRIIARTEPRESVTHEGVTFFREFAVCPGHGGWFIEMRYRGRPTDSDEWTTMDHAKTPEAAAYAIICDTSYQRAQSLDPLHVGALRRLASERRWARWRERVAELTRSVGRVKAEAEAAYTSELRRHRLLKAAGAGLTSGRKFERIEAIRAETRRIWAPRVMRAQKIAKAAEKALKSRS